MISTQLTNSKSNSAENSLCEPPPTVSDELVEGGATLLAEARETPWRSLNARLDAPAGLQISLFQELETLEERETRPSFGTVDNRD